MPRPAPDYIPERIRVTVEEQGKTFKSLALELGLGPTNLYSFFQSGAPNLRKYKELGDALGVSLDELYSLFEDCLINQYILDKVREQNTGSVSGLAKKLKLSPGFLLPIANGRLNGSPLHSAKKIAKALNMSLDELFSEYQRAS
jgi:transcriptional regulator with XRE-family HTH domain